MFKFNLKAVIALLALMCLIIEPSFADEPPPFEDDVEDTPINGLIFFFISFAVVLYFAFKRATAINREEKQAINARKLR